MVVVSLDSMWREACIVLAGLLHGFVDGQRVRGYEYWSVNNGFDFTQPLGFKLSATHWFARRQAEKVYHIACIGNVVVSLDATSELDDDGSFVVLTMTVTSAVDHGGRFVATVDTRDGRGRARIVGPKRRTKRDRKFVALCSRLMKLVQKDADTLFPL